MYMFHYLSAIVKLIGHGIGIFFYDFIAWCYSITDEVVGCYVGYKLVANLNIGNELLHSIFQYATTILGAYSVYKLKQIKFKINFKNIKLLFKNLLKK